MNVLLMLLGVLIVYIAVKLVYRYNWNKKKADLYTIDTQPEMLDDVYFDTQKMEDQISE